MCFACGFTYIDIPETVTYIDYCALTSDAFNLWGYSNRFIIICHAQKPPFGYDFLSFVYPHYSPGHFPQNYKLYVPSSSVELYKKADVWSCFQTILPIEDSNIIYSPYHTILENNSYALDGQKLSAPRKGLNIVKMSDGTTRKVFVK